MIITQKLKYFIIILSVFFCFVPFKVRAEEMTPNVTLEDITNQDATTLAGEAKLLVSIDGVGDDVSIVQLAFSFSGNLKFKSIQYLIGENNPEDGSAVVSPNVSAANRNKEFTTGIISTKHPLDMNGEKTKLFILTFTGEAGSTANVTVRNGNGQSYIKSMSGKETMLENISGSGALTASETGVTAVDANVRFKILDADVNDYPDATAGDKTGIYITVKDTTINTTYTAELNYTWLSKGGTLEDIGDETVFLVTNKVIAEDKFDISIWGEGFTTYELHDVDFSNGDVTVTSDDFYPIVTSSATVQGRTVTFYSSSKEKRELVGYAAVYRNGVLAEVKKQELSVGTTVVRLTNYSDGEYKAFIWEKDMTPAAEAVE